MNKIKKQIISLLGLFAFILVILTVSSTAAVYVEYPENEEQPPQSNVVLTDAFTTVSNADSYIHPVNHQQVIITEDKTYQSGGIWYQYPIDLNYDFSFEMYIYLGNKDQNSKGADGMTFTLHNDPRKTEAIGTYASALGAYGGPDNPNLFIENALSIEMDTYVNPAPGRDWDVAPAALTHFAVITPASHQTSVDNGHTNLQEVTDGYFLMDEWRSFDVSWNAASQTLSYQFEGLEEQTCPVDVQAQFNGTSVYWGFTGATGGSRNFQSVALTKLPQEPSLEHQKKVRNVTAGDSQYSQAVTANTGDIVEYRISVQNLPASMMDLIDTVFQDSLAPSLTYIDGSFRIGSTAVTPAISENMLSADLGTIAVGNTETITFRCRVTGSGSDGIIDNTAVIGSKYSAYLESEKTSIYVQPEVSITKSVNKIETYAGDTLTYTLTLTNKTGAGNWDGNVTDQLAGDLGNISVSFDTSGYGKAAPPHTISSGNLLTIGPIDLKDGAYLTVKVQADIQTDNEDVTADYKIANQAFAAGSGRTPSGSGTAETLPSNQVVTRLIPDKAAFTIIKNIGQPAAENLSFVFLIEYKKTETAASAVRTQYGTVLIAKGQTSGSIRFPDMKPGFYTVTEIENSWRYNIDSSTSLSQPKMINWRDGQDHIFTFSNNLDSRQWQSGNDEVINIFVPLS